MSVLDRTALEDSPLADLHAIASELGLDGYRRLRKAALIDAILGQGPAELTGEAVDDDVDPVVADTDATRQDAGDAPAEPEPEPESESEQSAESSRRRRGRRGGRGRGARDEDRSEPPRGAQSGPNSPTPAAAPEAEAEADGALVDGVVELIANGSGFIRTNAGEVSDDDVYISAAQVKRCELVNGDRVTGPRRAARRSERYASLIRIDTINGLPATEVADGIRYDDLPAAFPSVRWTLGSEDPTLRAIEALTPFGRGSRVVITGASRAGKSHALRGLAAALQSAAETQLLVALAGVRPEEITEWGASSTPPAAAVSFAASADAQDQAVELVVDQARRIAVRGGHAIVLIDTLDGLHPHSARKLLAAARQIVDGGSVTLIATASRPFGGETTVVALNAAQAVAGHFPAIDLAASGTIRAELLVGEDGVREIVRAREQSSAG